MDDATLTEMFAQVTFKYRFAASGSVGQLARATIDPSEEFVAALDLASTSETPGDGFAVASTSRVVVVNGFDFRARVRVLGKLSIQRITSNVNSVTFELVSGETLVLHVVANRRGGSDIKSFVAAAAVAVSGKT